MSKNIINYTHKHLISIGNRFPVVVSYGKNSTIFDINKKKYIDFMAGIGVNSLGHSDKEYIYNITSQLKKIGHCSNEFYNVPLIHAVENFTKYTKFKKCWFVNTGADTVELALKIVKKYGNISKKNKIISFSHSFHGRSCGALSLTGNEKYRSPFYPLIPNIQFATFNDINSVENLIDSNTAGVFMEPIQGEGGVHLATQSFMTKVRELCNKYNVLLVFDEVQCGMGRTGKLFAHEWFNVIPDILLLSKGLGNGFPVGAVLINDKADNIISINEHGSTFGDNPLAMVSANTVFNRLTKTNLLTHICKQSELIFKLLKKIQCKHIKEFRGIGLMIGIEFDICVIDIVKRLIANGLMVINAGDNVIRILPPLTISTREIKKGMLIFQQTINKYFSKIK